MIRNIAGILILLLIQAIPLASENPVDLATTINAPANEATIASFSIDNILAIADSNAVALKIIETKTAAAYAEVEIYRSEAFPNISFGSGVSAISQSLKANAAQSTAAFQSIDRINGYNFNWALNLHQPLITFGKVTSALKLAKIRDCSLKDSRRLDRDLFYLRVIREFSYAYLSQFDLTINEKTLERSKLLAQRVRSEFESGRSIRSDLLRIEATVQQNKAQLIAEQGRLQTTWNRLKQTINLQDTTAAILVITGHSLLTATPATVNTRPSSLQSSLKQNEAALYKQQARYLRSSFFPSVNLTGSITNQFMTIDTNGLIGKFNEAMAQQGGTITPEQFSEFNPKPGKYFDTDFFNYSIGLQLSWNIFDGKRSLSQYRQAKLKAEQALLELDELNEEQKVALAEAHNQIATINNMARAVELQLEATSQAQKQTEQDFADGMTDMNTLLESENANRAAARQLEELTIQRILALAQLRVTLGLPVYGENK